MLLPSAERARYTSLKCAEKQALSGGTRSIGSVMPLDNVLVETTTGIYKTGAARADSRFLLTRLDDVAQLTADPIGWCNTT